MTSAVSCRARGGTPPASGTWRYQASYGVVSAWTRSVSPVRLRRFSTARAAVSSGADAVRAIVRPVLVST